jgi:pyruvate dehydrogenase E1 component alpha subunit
MALRAFFAELMGRADGACGGRGGTMHLADFERGFMGANGIVAAGLPLALGSALAHRTLGRDAIAVPFFGDGALAEGLVHESLNLAALWKLPVLFVCENNGWGEFTPTTGQIAFALPDLVKAYDVPYRAVDGNDVAAVAAAAHDAAAAVRAGAGPIVLECLTARVGGHYEGDPQRGRDPAEIAALAERDPVMIARNQAVDAGATAGEIVALEGVIEGEIAAAVAFAKASPEPTLADSFAAVYTPAGS